MDKFNNKNFIFGQAFLKHFYTVFNYENEQLSLGINVNSKNDVQMYTPGKRPADKIKKAKKPTALAQSPAEDMFVAAPSSTEAAEEEISPVMV